MGGTLKATPKQLELFSDLFGSKVNRNGFIISTPDRINANLKDPSIPKYYTNKGYLGDSYYEKHIQGEIIVGARSPQKNGDRFTSVIYWDLDHPETQQQSFLENHKKYLGCDPSYTFVNPHNGHIYHLDMLTTTLNLNDVNSFSTMINDGIDTPVEVYPTGARSCRLPFGYPYELVSDSYDLSQYVAYGDPGKQIETAYTWHQTGKSETINTQRIRDAIKQIRHQETIVSLYEQTERVEAVSKVYVRGYGDYHNEVQELLTKGLWRPSQRHDATCKLSYFCVQQGMNLDQAEAFYWDWLDHNHNGFSKDYGTVNNPNLTGQKQIANEFRSLFRRARRKYRGYLETNGGKVKLPLSVLRNIYAQVKELEKNGKGYDISKYGRFRKVFKSMCTLYVVGMVHGLKPHMSKNYLESIGLKYQAPNKFCLIRYFLENRIIRRWYQSTPANNLTGVCRRWELSFLKGRPLILKVYPRGGTLIEKGKELTNRNTQIKSQRGKIDVGRLKTVKNGRDTVRNKRKTDGKTTGPIKNKKKPQGRHVDKQRGNSENMFTFLLTEKRNSTKEG